MNLSKTFGAAAGFLAAAVIGYEVGIVPSLLEAAHAAFLMTSGFVIGQVTKGDQFTSNEKKDNDTHQSKLNM